MMLDLIASEISMIIFENDDLGYSKIVNLLSEYLENNYKDKLMPDDKGYIIDQAFLIYEKM